MTMKKLFVLILSIASIHFAGGQQKGGYVKLNTFKGDTLRFLHANFRDGAKSYIGQRFEVLPNDFGLGVKWIDVGFSSEAGRNSAPGFVHEITLYNRDDYDIYAAQYFKERGRSHKIVYGLRVVFEKSFPVTSNPKWIPDEPIGGHIMGIRLNPDPFSAAMKLKDAIVKEITVLEY